MRYAPVGHPARNGESALSKRGLIDNCPLRPEAQPCRFTARRATNGVPLRGGAAEGGVPEAQRLPESQCGDAPP